MHGRAWKMKAGGTLVQSMRLVPSKPSRRSSWRSRLLNSRLLETAWRSRPVHPHLLDQATALLRKHGAQLAAAGRNSQGAQGVSTNAQRACCAPHAPHTGRQDGTDPIAQLPPILWLPPRQAGSMHTTAEGPPPPPQHGHAESLVLLSLAPLLSGGALLGAPRAGQQAECACTGRQGGAGWAAACRWNALRPQPANLQGVRRAQAEGNILP